MRAHLDRETDQEADEPEAVLVAEDMDEDVRIPGPGPMLERPAE